MFHTASPFQIAVADPQRDLVEPALNGTKNVLASVARTPSVKKVILTSSIAAVTQSVEDQNRTNLLSMERKRLERE